MAKTKLTKQRHDAIVKLIREGNYINRACQAVGIDQHTYDNWIRQGGQAGLAEEDIYFQFSQAIKKAESEFIAENVALIQTAAKKNWFAAAWLLERKYPAEFGRRMEIAVGPSKLMTLLQEAAQEEIAKPGEPPQLARVKDEADK